MGLPPFRPALACAPPGSSPRSALRIFSKREDKRVLSAPPVLVPSPPLTVQDRKVHAGRLRSFMIHEVRSQANRRSEQGGAKHANLITHGDPGPIPLLTLGARSILPDCIVYSISGKSVNLGQDRTGSPPTEDRSDVSQKGRVSGDGSAACSRTEPKRKLRKQVESRVVTEAEGNDDVRLDTEC